MKCVIIEGIRRNTDAGRCPLCSGEEDVKLA
jgi:hypothetical protein